MQPSLQQPLNFLVVAAGQGVLTRLLSLATYYEVHFAELPIWHICSGEDPTEIPRSKNPPRHRVSALHNLTSGSGASHIVHQRIFPSIQHDLTRA